MPISYIDRKGKHRSSSFNKKFDLILGYAIFKRNKDGILLGLYETSFNMVWGHNQVKIYPEIPIHHFIPQEGHFIIKTSKVYDDIEFLNRQGYHTNYYFKNKIEV